jgi:F-type H+-transporting ATPase subunit epsilon
MAAAFEAFLVTPEREVWAGEATMVIARGSEGEVGILAGHAPMLIQLGIGPLFIDPVDGERIAAAIDGGFLHVVTSRGETRVDVLAEFAELKDEIDLARARREKEEAERRVQDPEDTEAAADLAKAVTRIDLAG